MRISRGALLAVAVVLALRCPAPGSGGVAMAFELESSAFAAGATIPKKHTCDGPDLSPPLSWKDPPKGAAAFALVCDDPDAPVGTWVHWVLWNVPGSARQLAEGVPTTPTLPDGARQGTNDFKRAGYGGPCPPRGAPHRYFFRLYALDTTLGLAAGASRQALLAAMEGHVVGRAELMGRYGRP
jgi:hypothetical protein